ncbi:hypothetical protein MPTK1_6g10160 [Marchantia polymorpha subsp. ruderalis]|uniref:Transmembrane protein 45B n=2 Tax=Marchantia polymorpha TaxID=3197 RepID=A0AAF6BQH6_MARPO|nr:hypothetical protein MARPO_0016s0059 [Marchantia polymorpha]BBN14260.1 hypothetical protein Mp_6g10160 [Marchantia polymorpha subsp. ruderalis]|eukprot:PTQ44995.1 hypothetical protein MARPO_0016s0059 [Marchantia polymorpha]
MGTFIGHILPGMGFIFIGLWHLYNVIRNYVESPWNYNSRAWFPTRMKGALKYLEPLAIMFGSLLSISAELFICPSAHQPLADDWSIPSNHLNNFEHSTISLFFFIFGASCLCSELTKIHLPFGLLHLMGAFAFSQELILFHFHSADHMGLEGHYHWLLQIPIFVGLVCALVEIAAKKTFVVSFVRSVSIFLQGWWFVQMGLTLWIPAFTPTGCQMSEHDGHEVVHCETKEDDMRAKALANLYFSWYLASILIFSLCLYVGMMCHFSKQVHYEPLEHNLKIERSLKDLESQISPRSSNGDGSLSVEEMQGLTSIELER